MANTDGNEMTGILTATNASTVTKSYSAGSAMTATPQGTISETPVTAREHSELSPIDDIHRQIVAYGAERYCMGCPSDAADYALSHDEAERRLKEVMDAIRSLRGNGERVQQVFAWLVEKNSVDGAVWLTANYDWAKNANDACWFTRKQDAELFCFNLADNAKATEHAFIGTALAAAESAKEKP